MNDGPGTVDSGPGRRPVVVLAATDLLVVAALIVVGRLSHGENPVVAPVATLESIVPFALGWIVVATLGGLYRPDAGRSLTRVARETAVCWIAAANVGFLLRGSPLFEGGVPWTFTVVLTGLGLVLLLAWRVGRSVLGGPSLASPA